MNMRNLLITNRSERHMRRLIVIATAAAALAGTGVSSATAAPPEPFADAQRLCERQGGSFVSGTSDSGDLYICAGEPGTFSERELRQAERVCHRNGGTFISDASTVAPMNGYACTNISPA
jgi:hypothetical protein